MACSVRHFACYLVEWYQPAHVAKSFDDIASRLAEYAAAMSMSAEGTPVQLILTLGVPNDEVVFGVFTAPSAHLVAETCRRFGIPAQRITGAGVYTTPGGL